MSDNTAVSCALNLVLCGATGFGFLKIGPAEQPYAFTACLIGFTHGIVGLVSALAGDENARKIQDTTTSIVELIPLPLVNVDLFLKSDSNNIALGHGLFMVPLTVSVILGFWKTDDCEGDTDIKSLHTLKVLTILGNITSLVYLSINESSWIMGGMAISAFVAKFGAQLFEEHLLEGSAGPITYLGWSGFYVLAALAISGEK